MKYTLLITNKKKRKEKETRFVVNSIIIKKKQISNNTAPYLDGPPEQPSCSTSSPDRVSPAQTCPQASSGFHRPTGLCAWSTSERGCFAPSLQSSPRSVARQHKPAFIGPITLLRCEVGIEITELFKLVQTHLVNR